MASRKIVAQPAQEIEVCDCCGRDGYLQTCQACGGKYCLLHDSIITGCIIKVPVCRKCQDRPDVLAIVEKYAPLINAPRKERDAEISSLNGGCEQGLVVHLPVLRLTLKRKWFDMIASGAKKEEYRTPSKWIYSRLVDKSYDRIEFRNGYSSNAPMVAVEYLGWALAAEGKPEWGAIPGKRYVTIRLGRVLSLHNSQADAREP